MLRLRARSASPRLNCWFHKPSLQTARRSRSQPPATKGGAGPSLAPWVPSEEVAIYCEACEMWLRGTTQNEDHRVGKKHKDNLKELGKKVK